MKRKNHLEALVAMTLTDRGDPLVAEVALRGDEGGEVVLREGEAGEETEETKEEGEAGSREVGEVVDGIKVEEEEEEEEEKKEVVEEEEEEDRVICQRFFYPPQSGSIRGFFCPLLHQIRSIQVN